ncbi:MAG: PEP-CTERM sorting domain-containing protein [Isosphaeraceae bacterium]|nr:PEP-CTERM sorting domain-containing protein [Isosphaeraceae bacterium]
MVRRNVIRWTLLALAVLGARTATADPIQTQWTGDVEKDLPPGDGTMIIPNVVKFDPGNGAYHVTQTTLMNQEGRVSGWAIKDLRTHYDPASDTLLVGVNFYGIAGDADGNGIPGATDPRDHEAGMEIPHLGGHQAIFVKLDYQDANGGSHAIVAGVPRDKVNYAGPGTDGFNVAQVDDQFANKPISNMIPWSKPLPNNRGDLLFDPSALHPDFEFTIKNFTQLPNFDPSKGFKISADAGSDLDGVIGEDTFKGNVGGEFIPGPGVPPGPTVPEPATLLSWSAVAAAAFGIWRRRRSEA